MAIYDVNLHDSERIFLTSEKRFPKNPKWTIMQSKIIFRIKSAKIKITCAYKFFLVSINLVQNPGPKSKSEIQSPEERDWDWG